MQNFWSYEDLACFRCFKCFKAEFWCDCAFLSPEHKPGWLIGALLITRHDLSEVHRGALNSEYTRKSRSSAKEMSRACPEVIVFQRHKGRGKKKRTQTRHNTSRVGSGYSGLNVSWNRWGVSGSLLKTVWELGSEQSSSWQAGLGEAARIFGWRRHKGWCLILGQSCHPMLIFHFLQAHFDTCFFLGWIFLPLLD